jgi:TolB-like protein
MTAAITDIKRRSSRPATHNKLFHFITELRRRRVCRAITMYSVALWLICQIVDVVTPALELPEWTLKLVIVLGLLGLPVIIVMSWLLEITPDGLVIEGAADIAQGSRPYTGPRRIVDRVIDCSLILAALAIGAQLLVGALGTETEAAEANVQKIAVAPFRAATGDESLNLSEGLAIELQHELTKRYDVTVISSSDPEQLEGSLRLTGAVSTGDAYIRVAVTLIDFDTGVVAWSHAFEQPRAASLAVPAKLAREIAAAIPLAGDTPAPQRAAYVTQ